MPLNYELVSLPITREYELSLLLKVFFRYVTEWKEWRFSQGYVYDDRGVPAVPPRMTIGGYQQYQQGWRLEVPSRVAISSTNRGGHQQYHQGWPPTIPSRVATNSTIRGGHQQYHQGWPPTVPSRVAISNTIRGGHQQYHQGWPLAIPPGVFIEGAQEVTPEITIEQSQMYHHRRIPSVSAEMRKVRVMDVQWTCLKWPAPLALIWRVCNNSVFKPW